MSRWCLGLFASAVLDGVCIGWACALWLQRLFWFYVDFKGDVKKFFGLRFGRFSACPDGVWVLLHLQCPDGVCIGRACALWLQRLF